MAPRDEKTVDNIFAGCLDNLPPLSSKVLTFIFVLCQVMLSSSGCSHLHQLDLHRHADGEEHLDGVGLPKDQGILQRAAWPGISSKKCSIGPYFHNYEAIRSKSGVKNDLFQVVDMRWGVRDEMTNEHMTTVRIRMINIVSLVKFHHSRINRKLFDFQYLFLFAGPLYE